MIRLEDICKTFETKGGKVEALKNINLEIPKGSIFGIIGLSGAGKSTLVRCMNLLERPTSGKIYFEDRELTSLSKKDLRAERKKISMIFQQFNLLEQRTALGNVCYPLEISGEPKGEAKKRAKELLKIVSLEDREKSYPSQLSGGQKQRVAIARALATNPEVLLCDEATSALDPNTTRSILNLLKEINKKLGVTIIIITHEMKVVEQICTEVAVLEGGRVVEHGSVEDVFRSPKSRMARGLILPKVGVTVDATKKLEESLRLRLVFDGQTSCQPIVSNLAMRVKVPVNIIAASMEEIGGKTYGHMLLELPGDDLSLAKARGYLDEAGVHYEEEDLNEHRSNN